MIKVILFGCNGHMGREVIKAARKNSAVEIACGVDIAINEKLPIHQVTNPEHFTDVADVIIDFSHPRAIKTILAYALEKSLPVVLCTTGYETSEVELIQEASKSIPIFLSANMSLGVNLVQILCQIATNVLKDYDIEILEKHHSRKIDAPSGTALLLANAIRGVKKDMYPVVDRSAKSQPRNKNEIGIQSIRGGNIVGEHEVMFISDEDEITIKHTANNRSVFAKGAITACSFIVEKTPKVYTMHDLLGDKIL